MSAKLLSAALVLVLLAARPSGVDDKADEQAKEGVNAFLNAVKTKDAQQVLKLAAVPWFHDGKKVIRDRDELKQEFDKLFQKQDFSEMTFEIKQVVSYGSVRGKVNDKERELLDQVVEKEDRVVLVALQNNMKDDKVTLLVKQREGKAVVVGLRD